MITNSYIISVKPVLLLPIEQTEQLRPVPLKRNLALKKKMATSEKVLPALDFQHPDDSHLNAIK